MYRIIAVDLDGTLLSSKNEITEYTKKVIRFLAKKKFYFILASGRHHIDIIKIRDVLKIKSFIISSNGARVYNLDDQLMFSDNLNQDIALNLCQIAYKDKDIITQVYQNNQWYINNNKISNNFCSSFTLLKYKYFYLNDFTFNNLSKVFFTSRNFEKLYNLEKKIVNYYDDKINISFSTPGCLEVISGKTSKGHGLKLISNFLKISLNNFFSFGNGMNDQDMLAISAQAYIMKNADSRLKDILPHLEIIGSNDDDGIAKFLSEKFIKKM